MTPAARAAPVRGPRWTQKRFVDTLIDCYGPSARGPIDVTAVASHLGVTPTTVRRWLHHDGGPPSRVKARIPRHRIARLQRAAEAIERDNEGKYQYALVALDDIEAGRVLTPWQEQGWLDQHTVAIVEIHGKPWHQVVVTKGNHRAMAALRLRARVLSTVAVPNRFRAVILAHQVMWRLQNWRVHPARSQLAIGRTQVWMADAPHVDLAAEARRLDEWLQQRRASR